MYSLDRRQSKVLLHMRKPTIWVSHQVPQKPTCTVIEASLKLETLDLSGRGHSTIRVVKRC